jgi:predicted ribosome quality control (RQC) complex YloA/Tae2 family protein
MKPKEFILTSGTKIFLGKNASNNDWLVEEYQGRKNLILHTAKPGSPFCIIDKLNPTKVEIKESAIICASRSQDWRDNEKEKGMKEGTWRLKKKPKIIRIKKEEIKKLKERI